MLRIYAQCGEDVPVVSDLYALHVRFRVNAVCYDRLYPNIYRVLYYIMVLHKVKMAVRVRHLQDLRFNQFPLLKHLLHLHDDISLQKG